SGCAAFTSALARINASKALVSRRLTASSRRTSRVCAYRDGSGSHVERQQTPESRRTRRIRLLQIREATGAVAKPVHVRQPGQIEHVQEEIVQRRLPGVDEMTVALQLSVGASGEHDRQIVVRVDV